MSEKLHWGTRDDLDCVIICGGLGQRMFPLTAANQKTTLPVNEKPLLSYIVEFWRKYCNRFIFIASYQSDQIRSFVQTLDTESELIIEKEPNGIAMALQKARGVVRSPFVMTLGDCLCHGKFFFPGDMEQGVGYTIATNPLAIHQSYSINIKNGMAIELKEKPENLINDFLGMGVYFLSESVFDFIGATNPSGRTGKVEITDVIQNMASSGKRVHAVHFIGDYVNVTYPEDLLVADRIVKNRLGETPDNQPGSLAAPSPMALWKLDGIDRIERILVSRTLPINMFTQVIRFIRRTMPVGKVAVLCQPGVEPDIMKIDGVDETFLFEGDDMFRLGFGSWGLIKRLRREKFDAVALPYNNPNRTGYFHMETLAKLVCQRVYGLIPPARFFILSWWSIFRTRRFPFARIAERAVFYAIMAALAARRTLLNRKRPFTP